MKNKLLLAGAVLLVGGFALGDAVNANLLANISGTASQSIPGPVRSVPPGGTAVACNEQFKLAERAANNDIKIIKNRVAEARKTKDLCLKAVREAAKANRPTLSPRPKPSATSTSAI